MNTLQRAAACYLAAGLSVLPAMPAEKRPPIAWQMYQGRLPLPSELDSWLSNATALCVVCGKVSGNLEMIDFDLGGAAFDAWREAVQLHAPGLFERLVVESTPSGGYHVVYRSVEPVCGNAILARREFEADDNAPLTVGGKDYRPVRRDGRWVASVTLIETRGEGGLFLCAPSPGYVLLQGDMASLPVLTREERETLLGLAWGMDEAKPGGSPSGVAASTYTPGPAVHAESGRPGEAFNQHGDPRPSLERAGWVRVRTGENEHWRRPGKDHGASATLKGGVFYVFSSNAPPFEPHKGYSPFSVYALLEHGGDFAAAASALGRSGYGTPRITTYAPGVDLSAFIGAGPPPAAGGVDLTAFFGPEPQRPASGLQPVSVGDLVASHPHLRRPLIHGLLRRGETMNIIAAPKVRKSWASLDMATAVATGQPWLGRFPTTPGRVLIIDNELHAETSAYRIPKVIEARGVDMREIADRIHIDNVRGRLCDINQLGRDLRAMQAGQYDLVILDAFYRFMPSGSDENDNAGMAMIYNGLDRVASELDCSFVLIHHSSKGNQSGKSVTDIGAGAGAQSRAADAHLVLRPHEEDDVVVLDAAVRSWPPIAPACLRWEFPVWTIDDSLDPDALEGKVKPKEHREPAPVWTTAQFVDAFVDDEPANKKELWERCKGEPGLSERKVRELIEQAERDLIVTLVSKGDGRGGRRGYVLTPKSTLI